MELKNNLEVNVQKVLDELVRELAEIKKENAMLKVLVQSYDEKLTETLDESKK